jgi:ATP-dependent Clp protease ATP-binding subunit ClpA
LDNLNKEEEKWINNYKKNPPIVSKKDVEKAILSLTGLNIINNPSQSLETLKNNLKDNIINQDKSIDSIINSLYKSQAQLTESNKPIGSFLFIGKSGVGKTYLSELLATFWFGENHLIRFDMSEFAEKEKVSRLLGTTPGYIGYDVGGQLIEEVNKKPNSVILFDEIDKAHPDVINIFLQILDDGKITDGSGKIADFKNSIIIFTSNIGGISNYNSLGFGSENISESVEDSAKKYFRIEFLNRLNKIIQFNDLSGDDIQIIFNKEIEKINEKLKAQQIKFEISEKLRDFVLNKINSSNGAREIKRRIDEYIVDFLSKEIIINKLSNTSLILDLDSQEKIFIK